jgi:hypothetical protein
MCVLLKMVQVPELHAVAAVFLLRIGNDSEIRPTRQVKKPEHTVDRDGLPALTHELGALLGLAEDLRMHIIILSLSHGKPCMHHFHHHIMGYRGRIGARL